MTGAQHDVRGSGFEVSKTSNVGPRTIVRSPVPLVAQASRVSYELRGTLHEMRAFRYGHGLQSKNDYEATVLSIAVA